jgi:predicted nuclease with TOPRIM domain
METEHKDTRLADYREYLTIKPPLDADVYAAVEELVGRIDEFRAENARLTAEVEKLRSANSYVGNVQRLTTAENARLREALTDAADYVAQERGPTDEEKRLLAKMRDALEGKGGR